MIQERAFISIDKDTAARVLENGKVRDMLNLIPVQGGSSRSGEREFVLGNEAFTPTGLDEGDYLCKGIILDEENSLMYVFCALDEVHYLLEYNPTDNTATNILEKDEDVFMSSSASFVNGFVESGWIYYNDGDGLKRLDISRAKADEYGTDSSLFDLYLTAPLEAPTWQRFYAPSLPANTIGKDTWQFAYRFVYEDGAKSILSPLSLPVKGILKPGAYTIEYNSIQVTYSVSSVIQPMLKSVEVYYVNNLSGEYRLLEVDDSPSAGANTVWFDNPTSGTALPQAEALKPYENLPASPNGIAYPENRLVTVKGQDQFDLTGDYNFTTSIEYEDSSAVNPSLSSKMYLKEGGSYSVGLVFADEKGRRSPVVKKKDIKVPFPDDTATTGSDFYLPNERPYLEVTFTGTAPSWAAKVYVVMSPEQLYEQYIQVPAHLMFYTSPKTNAVNYGEGDDPAFLYLDGNVYADQKPRMTNRLEAGDGIWDSGNDEFDGYVAIDLQFPINIPTLPEVGWRVRPMFKHADEIDGVLRVSEVNTNSVRIEGYSTEDWSDVQSPLFVELYKEREGESNLFYDTGAQTDISAGVFSDSSVDVYGDTFFLDLTDEDSQFTYNQPDNLQAQSNTYVDTLAKDTAAKIESPTPSLTDNVLVPMDNESLLRASGFAAAEGRKGWSLDYSKSYVQRGLVSVENPNYEPKNFKTVLIASNTFVENTKINGLPRFDFEDEFSLPNERTPIRHLEVVNNVLLAIHERTTSSVYIGEKFLKQADGTDTVTTTDGFFGDERELIGGYGTIHPESVKTYNGQCFWWDANRGCVVRYAANGLEAISNYGLKDHFRTKGLTYSGYKVFGAIDPFLGLYVISFPSQNGLTAETWAWSIEDSAWIGRFSYTMEFGAHLGNVLATFSGGKIWKHHTGSTYNNFYGTQYDSRVTFVSNPDVAIDKSFDNISIDASSAWDVLSVTNPQGQETDLLEEEFTLQDNQYYADFKRDKNTASDLLNGEPAILAGNPIQSKYVEVTLRKEGSELQRINAVYIGYSILSGHLLATR